MQSTYNVINDIVHILFCVCEGFKIRYVFSTSQFPLATFQGLNTGYCIGHCRWRERQAASRLSGFIWPCHKAFSVFSVVHSSVYLSPANRPDLTGPHGPCPGSQETEHWHSAPVLQREQLLSRKTQQTFPRQHLPARFRQNVRLAHQSIRWEKRAGV